jgi:hypothetical protein
VGKLWGILESGGSGRIGHADMCGLSIQSNTNGHSSVSSSFLKDFLSDNEIESAQHLCKLQESYVA